MASKNRNSISPQARVRMLLKQISLDQGTLGQKLNISQPVISLALNGHNEKTFERIVDLLIREYGVTREDIYHDEPSSLQELQERLDRIEAGIEEIKTLLQDLRKPKS